MADFMATNLQTSIIINISHLSETTKYSYFLKLGAKKTCMHKHKYTYTHKHTQNSTHMHWMLFIWVIHGRPYYRSSLWHTMSSVTFCIVAKRYVLAKNCLKERIGNQGQKVRFLGRRHISTSGFAATATETAVFALFLPVQPSNRY